MTQPQSDPAADVGAALARLAEQTSALQRQIFRLETQASEREAAHRDLVRVLLGQVTELTEAKFITYRTLIDSQAAQVAIALDASKEAIIKAETANEKRFDSVNEFRQTLTDQARTFMARTEAIQLAENATLRIRELVDLVPTLATRMEVQVMTDRHAERIGELNDRINRTEGHGQGSKDNRALVLTLGALAVSIIIAAIALANVLTK